MPRIRQNAERYRVEDFQKAMDHARVDSGFKSISAIAAAADIPDTTLWRRWRENPDLMTLGELRKLLTVLPIPWRAILAFLGIKYKEEEDYG